MKTPIKIPAKIAFALIIAFSFSKNASADLTPPTLLVRQMHTLKSQLDILESQRDLVVINFPLIEAVGKNMLEITNDVTWYTYAHAPTIESLKSEVESMVTEAQLKDSSAYTTANDLRSSCLGCHSNVSPASGIKWQDLPGLSWMGVLEMCNGDSNHGINPYTCKNMYGMQTMVNYFVISEASKNRNFQAAAEVAKEIRRIAKGLVKSNFIHGGNKMLKNVASQALTIETLAKRLDSNAFSQAKLLSQSCTQCHTSK